MERVSVLGMVRFPIVLDSLEFGALYGDSCQNCSLAAEESAAPSEFAFTAPYPMLD
jgi:hypothetical protein